MQVGQLMYWSHTTVSALHIIDRSHLADRLSAYIGVPVPGRADRRRLEEVEHELDARRAQFDRSQAALNRTAGQIAAHRARLEALQRRLDNI